MQTLFIVLGIWLLVNVLFVVIMIPPRQPRRSNGRKGFSCRSPVFIRRGHHLDEDDSVSLHHATIVLGVGAFFSLTPPLLDAYDELKAFIRTRHSRVGTGDDFPAADQPPGSPNSRIPDGRHGNSSEPTSTKSDEQT